jgi:hypothetical protein
VFKDQRMAAGKVRYRCEGFYPIEAHNVMHAGLRLRFRWRVAYTALRRDA